jgi:hypothetical protein
VVTVNESENGEWKTHNSERQGGSTSRSLILNSQFPILRWCGVDGTRTRDLLRDRRINAGAARDSSPKQIRFEQFRIGESLQRLNLLALC